MLSIKKKRQLAGLSQAELAGLINVNQTAISQWERGITTPSLDNARRLASVFGCTIDDLCAGEPEKEAG